ncbi:MAG: pilin [Geobacteraceae bacterium]|nr:pilin [Geobacteraceae bacterium]
MIFGNQENGFTLIELMIVVMVIAVLASICIIQFNSFRMKGCNSAALSDLSAFRISIESYFAEHQRYP